mmetsp:Transcript_27818/g.70372  ORF Transcript_27818/g.70372 Transcript_27818/m.70372 type:complete len:203 (+) Transcript_27818:495-1103(+)
MRDRGARHGDQLGQLGKGGQCSLNVAHLGNLAEVETNLSIVALADLRLRKKTNGHVVPLGVERRASVLHQADTKETVNRLRGCGEHANVGENTAEEDALHTPGAQLILQRRRREGTIGPLVHHDLTRLRRQCGVKLVARVVDADQVVPHRGTIAVRAAVGDRHPAGPRCSQEPLAALHARADWAVLDIFVVLANTAGGLQEV